MGGLLNSQPQSGGLAQGGLLGNPLLNLGVGLLSASGPSTTPTSFGQALGQGVQFAQNAQQQSLRNQLVRSRLEDDVRKRSATQELQGLLGEGDPTLGVLAGAAPNAVAQALIGQKFPRQSALERRANALGLDLKSLPEDQKTQLLGGDAGATAALDQALKVVELQNAQRVATEGRTKAQREKGRREFVVRSSLDRINELRQLNQRRREFVDNPLSAAASPIQAAEVAQRFEQVVTDLVLKGALDPLRDVGNRLTDSGRKALFQSKISGKTLPNVADKILDDMEKGLLEAGNIIGLSDLGTGQPQAPASREAPTQPRIFNQQTVPKIKSELRSGDIFNHPDGRTGVWDGARFRVVN